jgi:hypothetical protein
MSDNGNNEIWVSDLILAEILQPIFKNASPFQCLPEQVERDDTCNKSSLQNGFKRLLWCSEADQVSDVVFIWVLNQPYKHQDGTQEPSTVVRIEKTEGSIKKRWPAKHINSLLTDHTGICSEAILDNSDALRTLAYNECNLTFFREVISKYGPLRILWSDVEHLNKASVKHSFETSQGWESFICKKYRDRYKCLPLKDKKCG